MVGDRRALVPAVVGVTLGSYWLPALAATLPPLRSLLRIRDHVATRDGVALTFDDGPHPDGTPAVLDLLAAAGARATFFLVGEQVERRPRLAAEIVAAGHGIGVHCHRHRNLLALTPGQVVNDVLRARAVIVEATGEVPALYRPPYGVFTAAALVVAHRQRLQPMLWSRSGRDWERRATEASIAARLANGARPGDVLLLHDADFYSAPGSWQRTVAALPLVLEALRRRRLELVLP